MIDTAWALLVLQRAVPKVPTFEFQISDQCVAYGQPLESFEPDDAIVRGTEPYTWTWSGNMDLTVAKSTENVFTITYPDGWIGSEAITVADLYESCTDPETITFSATTPMEMTLRLQLTASFRTSRWTLTETAGLRRTAAVSAPIKPGYGRSVQVAPGGIPGGRGLGSGPMVKRK